MVGPEDAQSSESRGRSVTHLITAEVVLGTASWGTGSLLFGLLAWKSGILPNWLAVVGIIGGIAGWTIVNLSIGFISLALPVAFIIWGLGTGGLILSGRVKPASL